MAHANFLMVVQTRQRVTITPQLNAMMEVARRLTNAEFVVEPELPDVPIQQHVTTTPEPTVTTDRVYCLTDVLTLELVTTIQLQFAMTEHVIIWDVPAREISMTTWR